MLRKNANKRPLRSSDERKELFNDVFNMYTEKLFFPLKTVLSALRALICMTQILYR